MPLVRMEVRNEYGLGASELHKEGNKEDPKEVLEGVAVAGLVGILRQLGDLAEFAAEVFHGLQEQVMITSSRSHKLMGRLQRIEAALPSMEKLVLAQRSHLHFAYTTGASWHTRVRCEQSHFIYSDLPRFIMDSYEQCRGPPRLNLLDKFDPGGPGSCLKRYSHPSFFKRASNGSEVVYVDKGLKDKKGRKIKKRRSCQKIGEVSRGPSMSNYSGRTQYASLDANGQAATCQTVSTYYGLKSDLGDFSLDSRNGLVDLEQVSHPSYSIQCEGQESKESSYQSRLLHRDSYNYAFIDEKGASVSCAPKSDTGDQSISLDSRNASVECISHPSYSILHEEQESKDSTYPSSILHSDSHDCAFSAEIGASVYDALKLDSGDSSISFDSRNGSVDLEHVSCPSYSSQLDEQVSKVCYSSSSRMQNDDHYFSSNDEMGAILYGDNCISLSEEPTGPNSSHITWDEKTRLLEGTSKEYDHETLEMPSISFDSDNMEKGATHFETPGAYVQAESLGKFSAELDGQIQESGATNFETSERYDHDESLDKLSTNLDLKDEERAGIQFETDSRMGIPPNNENLSIPVPDNFQLADFQNNTTVQMKSYLDKENVPVSTRDDLQHDIGSETDDYMDALNTIESDYESDLDCRTKQEMEPCSDKDNKAIEHQVDMLSITHSGNFLPNSESLVTACNSPNNGAFGVDPSQVFPKTCFMEYHSPYKLTCEDITNSVPFESFVFPQPPQIVNEPFNPTNLSDVDPLKNGDVLGSSNVKSVLSSVSSSDSRQHSSGVPTIDKITSSSSELQKPPPEHSGITSVKFWTNGGLLGLEPSKPPDFSVVNVPSFVSPQNKDDAFCTVTHKQDVREKSSNCSEEASILDCSRTSHDDRKGGILAKRAPRKSFSGDLSVNLQKLSDSYNQNFNSNSQGNAFSQTSATVQTVNPNIESTKASRDNSGNSSQMLQLGNMLFQTEFYQKSSLDKEEGTNPTHSLHNNGYERHCHCDIEFKTFSGGSKVMPGCGSPMLPPSSSPPLGHIKISFHPTNGFKAPMELKFPDENISREGRKDLFPSFQLVPESTFSLHDAGSDSEHDTFCRSSPYGSDCPSHLSDSNSEQWKSSESPRSKDRDLYDALCRISFTDSALMSWETGQTAQEEINNNYQAHSFAKNSKEDSLSGHLFDIPSLDTLHPSFKDEFRRDCDRTSHSEPHCSKELTPPPPPLPPSKWLSMKQEVDLAEDRQVPMPDSQSSLGQKIISTITQQPKPAHLNHEQIIEAARALRSKLQQQEDLQKLNGQKAANQTAYGKGVEEKEDFLYQIRTKSFSLRRTVRAKSTATEATPKSVQVSAILEKANAIRQAVGSDDGEDDNWIDT